jgi:hypothetical protein
MGTDEMTKDVPEIVEYSHRWQQFIVEQEVRKSYLCATLDDVHK